MYVCIIYTEYVYDVYTHTQVFAGELAVWYRRGCAGLFCPTVGHFWPYSRSLLTLAVWYRRGCAGSGGYKQMYEKSAHSRSLLAL